MGAGSPLALQEAFHFLVCAHFYGCETGGPKRALVQNHGGVITLWLQIVASSWTWDYSADLCV